ncbi:NADP-dependent oxidoreductase domain-containing protein, partial [Epithele typhae]|uniref:NADP-dependent oxidoreductase domain-containing protein n=1 Tax=Epithele typhae TaxID=378194 RepID=UPI002008E44E
QMERDFERDIIPMARAEGMALAPWDVLSSGRIRTDAEEEKRRQTGENGRTVWSSDWERTEAERAIRKVLEEVGEEVGAKSIQAVAIAYVMQKTQYVFPIVGGRKVEHMLANIAALEIALSDAHIARIESASSWNPGFPMDLFVCSCNPLVAFSEERIHKRVARGCGPRAPSMWLVINARSTLKAVERTQWRLDKSRVAHCFID